MPFHPTVSSIGIIMYECANYLVKVLSLLTGKTEHPIKISNTFMKEVRELKLDTYEELLSYDVSALCTSMQIDKALEVIRVKLEADNTLKKRTPLALDDIICLLSLYHNCTYFLFQGEYYYHQIHGANMGSPMSPNVYNLYMELFNRRLWLQHRINPSGGSGILMIPTRS